MTDSDSPLPITFRQTLWNTFLSSKYPSFDPKIVFQISTVMVIGMCGVGLLSTDITDTDVTAALMTPVPLITETLKAPTLMSLEH